MSALVIYLLICPTQQLIINTIIFFVDDDNWMEGVAETDHSRRGMFPVSFVHMLQE